jgi:hypothetical protein
LKHGLRIPGKPVDAGCDQRLHRVGNRGAPFGPFGEHADGFLDEERVSLRLRKHVLANAARDRRLGNQRVDQLRCVVLGQRSKLDRRPARPPSAPVRVDLEQLGPGQAQDEEGGVAHPVREVLDQAEQRLL